MKLTNLGTLTDLATLGAAAEITAHPEHLAVRCREQPGFYWGNFLQLRRAPAADAVDDWIARFGETFGDDPRIRHVSIGWSDGAGDGPAIAAFRERGYLIDDCTVMVLETAPPARPLPAGMTIDRCTTDADWQAVLELGVISRDARHGEASFRAYLAGVIAERRKQAAAGHLRWYLARIDGEVAGDMGLFVVRAPPKGLSADGIDVELPVARFQAVKTHPDFRGRGVCSTLLTRVCRDGLIELGLKTLVILVDPEGPAWRIYRRQGFEPVGHTRGAWRPPTRDWQAGAD